MLNDDNKQEYDAIVFPKGTFYVRKNNFGDMYTFRENINGKQYKNLVFSPNDVVLDIGGHIGTFCVPIVDKVSKIISVEMDADNFKLLEANTRIYDNIDILNLAVVSDLYQFQRFAEYYKAKNNSGAHSMHVSRGRGDSHIADTICISELLNAHEPSIIKCDAEGSEYDLFENLKLPIFVKQIVIEFHFGHKNWRDKANKIISDFIDQGFTSSDNSNMNDNKNWTRVIYFVRR